ncbi:MAG: diguanylate cyclase [Spirochaetales bacterium]|nr:diguanylate cyclase [Spirochaetales bacterium]
MTRKNTIILLEIIFVSLLISGANVFFPDNPGYHEMYYIPYLGASALVAAVYGAGWGFLTFTISFGIIVGGLPFLLPLFHPSWSSQGYWRDQLQFSYIPGSVGLLTIYIFGVIRSSALSQIGTLKVRIHDLSRENWLTKKKSDALSRVNFELDEQVSRQQEAITSLHTQLRKLDTLDVNQGLNVLLETVHIYTRAVKASIWRYEDSTRSLQLAASRGWDESEVIATSIPVDGTIEGWVYRNNSLFSIRMLLQYDNLEKMDIGRNIITIPLNFDQRVWGILNIQEMPFEKYNLHSERILQIITTLAEHSIEKAVSYESIIQKDEIDERTGLPLFSQFYRMLDEETRNTGIQKGSFSIILIELINFGWIQENHGADNAKSIIRSISESLESLSERNVHCFQYKEDSQIALLIPSVDFDGVSLFSLEALEKLNSGNWEIEGDAIPVEAVIGFSVFSGGDTPDSLLEQAESLLEMQRV